ncbi:NAD(P)H-dependent flavin oxidoreductase [Ignatzschineria cameli]|uniref:NAD(P)H-dependent flavin oxidoreductase n=1 Tax=Ignatzschineria cameli TaxID=2182793 RepID=UPI000D61B715|nr:nitronate monooxygenase [Ignatzschineria cameli]PWD87367.1 nitronate monooxygenase [Ignatzschineria cameli]
MSQQLQQTFLESLANLEVPVMVAPMFLVSGPKLLLAACRAGVIGSLPLPNARNITILEGWLEEVKQGITLLEQTQKRSVPWLLNMIVHRTYDRFDAELELVREYQPPLVTTALGSPKRVVADVHRYGGAVFADVTNVTLAKKAVDAGVDGLILVSHGAGGHTGLHNPFALIAEVRQFWSGPIALSGAMMNGRDILAAKVLGADLAVMGTRFIGAEESLVVDQYRQMLLDANLDDIILSDQISGVPANWLRASLESGGVTLNVDQPSKINFSGNISDDKRAWRDIWSAGEGVGQIKDLGTVADIVAQLSAEYQQAKAKVIGY